MRVLCSMVALVLLAGAEMSATTLKESVKGALESNPIVQERLKNYRAVQQDLNIAESEYYPRVDLRASAGYNSAGRLNDDVNDIDYTNYESALVLTQNLFNGFGTTHKVDYQEARILAAAYNYVEKANDVAFNMTNAYLNVLKSGELVATAQESVTLNTQIYKKVKELYNGGLTTDSEVKKVQSSLSLARSNLIVQKNNARDSQYNYRRVLGRMPQAEKMQKPHFDMPMPASAERAAAYAVAHNPSMLVSRYNIKGAQALWEQRQKEYYPTLDLEVSQYYNDADKVPNGFDQPDDRFRARLVLNYNLYRGGADRAEVQKQISKIHQETEIRRDIKRQVIEGLDLSWNAYEMISQQIVDLREYKAFSEKTLELYRDEYDLGRRSLLDLLSAQNDLINAKMQLITAEYDMLFAKYRVLDAMGLMVLAITGDTSELNARVNLGSDAKGHERLDTLPVSLDADGDRISDSIDQCDNSEQGDFILPYGCRDQGIAPQAMATEGGAK